MPRRAKLPIRKDPASGRWCYDLPPSMSETGKRQRKFFEVKDLADDERREDLLRVKEYGIQGRLMPPAQAQDASRALELLRPYDVSLYQAARFYHEAQEKLAASMPFADVWTRFLESRENKSDAHTNRLEQIGRKLVPLLGKRLICSVDHESLRGILRDCYPTASGFNLALRSVSPAFNLAVSEGWASENPCQRIQKIDTGRRAIEVLKLEQCRALFRVCKDYREDESLKEYRRVDCRKAQGALALMLFAGVRPQETSRLEWEDIDLAEGTVLVRNTKAKTDRSRYFKMPEVLKAWLDEVPLEDRNGSVVPSNWKRIYSVIREKAGISEMQDVMRKTFATAHLAAYGDVNKTRSIMGHEVGDVIFTHYRGLMRPKEAKEFWKLYPGTENQKLEVVA